MRMEDGMVDGSQADSLWVSRGSDLLEAEVDGEMVALHIDNGKCYGFNATAYRIWKMIEEPMRVTTLCDRLSKEFNVEQAQCQADVLALLDGLARDGLVDLGPAKQE